MKRAAAVLMVAVAGCATTSQDLRRSAPEVTFHSTKEPAAIAGCLAESYQRLGNPSVYPSDAGREVAIINAGNTMLLFSISNDGTVAMRRAGSAVPYKKGVAGCL